MILVDTSVWIDVLNDATGQIAAALRNRIGTELYALSRFNQLELLQGAKNENEWKILEDYLSTQYYLEASEKTWRHAARIYFELRRRGVTINSPVDCCIAQIALEHSALLLHRDKDFERVSIIRPIIQEYFQPHK